MRIFDLCFRQLKPLHAVQFFEWKFAKQTEIEGEGVLKPSQQSSACKGIDVFLARR